MNIKFVSSTFSTLCQVFNERANELWNYGNKRVINDEDDDERDSDHSISDSVLKTVKPQSIQKMTNFSPTEIDILYDFLTLQLEQYGKEKETIDVATQTTMFCSWSL